jgi:radical SAM protein with 4Fe4S-binding SPASM domain
VTVVVAGDTAVSIQTLQLFKDIQANEVYPIAEIALAVNTLANLATALSDLQAANVTTFSFFAIVTEDENEEEAVAAQAMPQTADWVEEIADEANVRFIWQPPVQRNPDLPLAAQIQQGPRSSGDVSVRIEADGTVIPPRGPYQAAGNILSQAWPEIWDQPAFTRYRERVNEPTRCVDCPGLALCVADCPREKSGWAYR